MTKKGRVSIGIIQHACSANCEENLNKAVKMIKEAASKGAKVICTQELFKSQYFPQTIDVFKSEVSPKLCIVYSRDHAQQGVDEGFSREFAVFVANSGKIICHGGLGNDMPKI